MIEDIVGVLINDITRWFIEPGGDLTWVGMILFIYIVVLFYDYIKSFFFN